MNKRFRAFEPNAVMLVPPDLGEWLPQNHLSRFIADIVETQLDLKKFYASYAKSKGQPPYDPRLMVRVLLYGYCVGVRSSRELERVCVDAIDDAEDARFGKDKRGDELPPELARRESRLVKLAEARAALEADAAVRARKEAEKKARDKGDDDDIAAQKGDDAAKNAVVRPKAQRNFTDPDSRIMKTADGSFHYAYNAQAIVDADHQIIVATTLTNIGVDVEQVVPLVEKLHATTGVLPGQVLADAGYCSASNLDYAKTVEAGSDGRTEFFIATGRMKHGERVPEVPRGRIPANATLRERMARKLKTKKGRAVYARRKAIVEPVFGQIHTRQGKFVLLRGLEQAAHEWYLIAACHNLMKLHTMQTKALLATPAALIASPAT
ncbi:transposase [Cryobacterium roopkundense]|uniref:transposase n=1 Tax=Cryobacterium roopkundense TaxID=1001240 RepID=UPI003B831DA4